MMASEEFARSNSAIAFPPILPSQFGLDGSSSSSAGQGANFASNVVSTSLNQMDEMIKDYLIYRGFNFTYKAFEQDLKQDKDKGFKSEKLTDQLLSYVHSYDFSGLLDYWSFLEHRYFSHLTLKPASLSSTALTRKYELFLLRYYLVYAIQTSKPEKAIELLENYASKLQSQNEWKEWYCLPFLKNPEENPIFSIYFSKNWIDTFIISLQNFLNIVVQSLQSPKLLNYEEDAFWSRHSLSRNMFGNAPMTPMASGMFSAMQFEQEYLQNEITDEIQLMQPTQTHKHSNTFISMIKNITNNSKPKPASLSTGQHSSLNTAGQQLTE